MVCTLVCLLLLFYDSSGSFIALVEVVLVRELNIWAPGVVCLSKIAIGRERNVCAFHYIFKGDWGLRARSKLTYSDQYITIVCYKLLVFTSY